MLNFSSVRLKAPELERYGFFVMLRTGRKAWKLYRPLDGFVLPNGPSDDLSQEVIGEPIMEAVLEPGDVLYMPKGTVHQALAQGSDSVHLTLSTYQRWTWGDVTSAVLQETLMVGCTDLSLTLFCMTHSVLQARSEPVCLPSSMREELPFGFLSHTGCYTGDQKSSRTAARELAKRLRDLADSVEKNTEILKRTVDTMAYGFITSRMAPKDEDLPKQGMPFAIRSHFTRGTIADQYPTLEDNLLLTGSSHCRLMPVLADDGSVEDGMIQVLTCFANDPQSHMMVYPEVEALIPSDTMQVDEASSAGEEPDNHEGEKMA